MTETFEASQVQQRPILAPVVLQHIEDAAVLHCVRCLHVRAPHVKLHHLRRTDDRIAAHLHGLSVAGDWAWPLCEAELESPTPSRIFTAASVALELGDTDRLDRLCALVDEDLESRPGLFSAFGWSERARLRGIVANLLKSADAFQRLLGIAASAMHRVDPGIVAARRMEDPDPAVRARALRTAGELGLRQLVSTVATFIDDDDPQCRFWAARSAVLLGDRERALDHLTEVAVDPGDLPPQLQAHSLQLALQAMDAPAGTAMLRRLARSAPASRVVIRGTGLVGDPAFVPWLLGQMGNDATARMAGEAFSLITGTDLAWLDLERKPPEVVAAGPNDNPGDTNVEMDADEGLPWPDQSRIEQWWASHRGEFRSGERYFMGAPVSRQSCLEVLRTGFQRQRIAAAVHRVLIEPGTMLFEWRAPAARQARELASMS
jgi:uncharacterized protein (TIGR02270 family)